MRCMCTDRHIELYLIHYLHLYMVTKPAVSVIPRLSNHGNASPLVFNFRSHVDTTPSCFVLLLAGGCLTVRMGGRTGRLHATVNILARAAHPDDKVQPDAAPTPNAKNGCALRVDAKLGNGRISPICSSCGAADVVLDIFSTRRSRSCSVASPYPSTTACCRVPSALPLCVAAPMPKVCV